MLVLAILCFLMGVTLDVTQSQRDKGTLGPFGLFRPTSVRGLKRGLPFYIAAIVLLVLVP